MNPNPLVQYLNKPADQFTKADLIKYIEDNNIEMVNFRYAAHDGRLKTLNFVISSRDHLDTILTCGERVDGSSLFKHIEAGSSDLYVIPRYKTAFVNPFAQVPTIDILCSFYNKDGEPLDSAPEHILRKAHQALKDETGYSFEVMGELEYYVISKRQELFHADDQRGYHESAPFVKWGDFRRKAMLYIAQTGGLIKYGHSEVGNFTLGEYEYEQNEIEFTPTTLEDAADQLLIAKWILRNLAREYGVNITFAPKITVGKAGSGLHVHTRLMKDGRNVMVENGKLSDVAKRAIAGYLTLAPSLTAFGNQNPTSYFRLVPHQEAPTNICWGDRNRSVVVRVPLGWIGADYMVRDANPADCNLSVSGQSKQTFEFRVPDGSADIYLTVAGLVKASMHGINMPNALERAKELYVDANIFKPEFKEKLMQLKQLPASCWESAEALEAKRGIFQEGAIFPDGLIDARIKRLKAFNDKGLSEKLYGKDEEIAKLVSQFIHIA